MKTRHRWPTLLLGSALLLDPASLEGQGTAPPVGPPALQDLRSVLDTGAVIQDRNGDGVVDFLEVRILLGIHPSAEEVAAAANLAARLGYETSATNLGLAGRAGTREVHRAPVILVGAGAMEAAGVEGGSAALLEGLAPGQGVVAFLPPGGGFAAGALALAGYDATGLLAVSAYLSGRYPAVWAPDGIVWREVAEKVEAFAAERELGEGKGSLDRIVVDGSRPGVARARWTLEVPGVDALEGAAAAFQSPDTAAALEFQGLYRLDVRIVSPDGTRTLPLRPAKPWEIRDDAPFRPGGDAPFSLPALYQVGGLFRDTNRDLVPDETAAYLSLGGAAAPASVVDLATRIGLETAGIRLPLAKVDGEEDDPTAAGLPVLVGVDHYQIRRLQEEGKLPGVEGGPGVGFVRFVEKAFGDKHAIAVGGGDEAGLQAATDWLARRAPYLWTYGKGEYRLADAETELRRFLQAQRGPGQVALALTKLGMWVDRLAEDPPTRVEVELAALEAPEGVDRVAEAIVRERFPDAAVSVRTWPTGFGVGDTVFVQEWEIPWEVEEVRQLLATQAYPGLRAGAPAHVEIRVSEPPEIRTALEAEIRKEMAARGVTDATVQVLSAYKQGYSWITDVLLPRLRELPVASVALTYHTLEESEEVRWQTIAAETRWLQEVYPFDAVLARELGISDSVITFHPTRRKDPIYTFEARDAAGTVILKESFDPRYVVRPFFDLFPEYEQVRVTTGWLTVVSAGDTLVDRRIVTDPERFWDRLQTEGYQGVIDYLMDSQDGDPSGSHAPFFDEFRVDLRLSEPNYRIGVDEETISALEALHEDIYFETHTLFTLLGGRYQTTLSNPGRVLPFVDPTGAGRPGRARLSLTGKERGRPELVVRTWGPGSAEPGLKKYDLAPLPVKAPGLVGAMVAAGEDGVRRLQWMVTVSDSLDRYQDFKARSSEGSIDRQFLSVELLEGMVGSIRRLHGAGIMEDALAWDRVGEVALDLRLEKDSTYQRTVTLPRSRHPRSTENPRLAAEGWTWSGERIVQWDTPIPPSEHDTLLARLATFPEVTVYYLTDSYLGHRVWAADFLPPHEARYLSQAKLNALRPTLFVSGREHANEVSSTSHILRLGELLVTDSTWRALLDRVNVVLHPMTNPDGALLAWERQLVNPDHMLHAGRPGALGMDATSGGSEDPIYPEALARPMLRESWLPDIYLNPHGYPSHEWVQYFAGYSAWARGRRVGPRTWWVPRGWFIPGFSWVEDKENPSYQTAQFAILDSMAAAMTGDPGILALNSRLYARYKKYGIQEREGFTEYFHNGMVVSQSLQGQESIGTGVNSPRITYFSVTSEAPDETARGEYLRLMGEMGLAHIGAALRYLAGGESRVEREVEAFDQAVTRKVFRVKPVLPKQEEGKEG